MVKNEMYYCTVCHRRHRKGSKIYLKHRKYMWHYR